MTDSKRRSANALPFQSSTGQASDKGKPAASAPRRSSASVQDIRTVKIEAERLREKLQKSVIDNPHTAKKAALLISLWIEGKTKARQKKAG